MCQLYFKKLRGIIGKGTGQPGQQAREALCLSVTRAAPRLLLEALDRAEEMDCRRPQQVRGEVGQLPVWSSGKSETKGLPWSGARNALCSILYV